MTFKKDIGIDISEAKMQEIIAEASTALQDKLSSKEALAVTKKRRGISIDAPDEAVLGVGAMIDPGPVVGPHAKLERGASE